MQHLTIHDIFKPTTYNKGHCHYWMKGRGYTTIAYGHNHKIDIKRMLALPGGKDVHIHRLIKYK